MYQNVLELRTAISPKKDSVHQIPEILIATPSLPDESVNDRQLIVPLENDLHLHKKKRIPPILTSVRRKSETRLYT